jgi:hypothetical protein
MLDKLEKQILRKQLFYHLDGLAMCGVVPVLHEWGLLERVFHSSGDVDQLAAEYRANSGYLNVAITDLPLGKLIQIGTFTTVHMQLGEIG